jgi:hypothetical protein
MRGIIRRTSLILAAASLFACRPAAADDYAAKLQGSWRLISQTLQIVGETTPPREPLGHNPNGYLVLLPEGRMMVLLTAGNRKPPTNDAENAALLKTMLAYSGRYTVDAEKFVTKTDISWNEILTGKEQARYHKVEGDKLFIRTAEQPSGLLPGKRVVGTLEFVRER